MGVSSSRRKLSVRAIHKQVRKETFMANRRNNDGVMSSQGVGIAATGAKQMPNPIPRRGRSCRWNNHGEHDNLLPWYNFTCYGMTCLSLTHRACAACSTGSGSCRHPPSLSGLLLPRAPRPTSTGTRETSRYYSVTAQILLADERRTISPQPLPL